VTSHFGTSTPIITPHQTFLTPPLVRDVILGTSLPCSFNRGVQYHLAYISLKWIWLNMNLNCYLTHIFDPRLSNFVLFNLFNKLKRKKSLNLSTAIIIHNSCNIYPTSISHETTHWRTSMLCNKVFNSSLVACPSHFPIVKRTAKKFDQNMLV